MNSMNAEKKLNREERFRLYTPVIAFWQYIKEIVNSPTIDTSKEEYTEKDYIQVFNEKEIAKELSKGIEAESILQEATKKKVNNIKANIAKDIKVAKRENTPKLKITEKEEAQKLNEEEEREM